VPQHGDNMEAPISSSLIRGKDDVECCRNAAGMTESLRFFFSCRPDQRACKGMSVNPGKHGATDKYCTGEHPIGIIETPLEQTAEA